MSRRRVLVSSEVLEEIEEIYLLLKVADPPYGEIVLDAPEAVIDRLPQHIKDDRRLVLLPYARSTTPSVRNKVVGLLEFMWRALRRRPQLIFSGFSMMKHRVASGVLHVPHFAYIRGVTFDPATSVGISDQVSRGRIGRFVPQRVVATYHADRVFTVGEMNRRFVIGRGMSPDAVDVVGPVWLADLEGAAPTAAQPRTIFVTGAWAAHGFQAEHDAQTKMLASVAEHWRRDSELVIRVHPRDGYDYRADARFADVALSTELPGEFLASLRSGDVLVAPLSTLAFEALHLRAAVAFYSDDQATRSYNHVYDWLGIVPHSGDSLLHDELRTVTSTDLDVFSPIDLEPARRALASLT